MEFLITPDANRAARRRLYADLGWFVAAAFGLTWLLVGAYIHDAPAMSNLLGPMQLGAPAFFVAVYAPTLAAILVTAVRDGRTGLSGLFGSLVRSKVGWVWIAISVLGYPALWLVVTLIRATFSGELASFDPRPWLIALPLVLLGGHVLRDPGALGEELGWRGFALPRLLELTDARAASIILGVVWAVWHLPAFFLSSLSQSSVDFGVFVVNVTAFSVLMTWLFVNTRGSVLWAGIVPHMLFNATPKAGITPIVWVTVLAAVAVLVLGGKHLRGIGRPRAASSLPEPRGTFGREA
jgi:membrane protease YdiL (CAAX protease family)